MNNPQRERKGLPPDTRCSSFHESGRPREASADPFRRVLSINGAPVAGLTARFDRRTMAVITFSDSVINLVSPARVSRRGLLSRMAAISFVLAGIVA